MSFFGSLFGRDLPKEAQVKHDLALIHLEKGNYSKALELLVEAEAIEPGHDDLKALRAKIETATEGIENEEYPTDGNRLEDPWHALWYDEFDQNEVQMFTENGFRIENVAFGEGRWYLLLRHQQEGDPEQRYLWIDGLDNNTFNEYFEARFAISTMAHDGENWFFVFEERPDADFQAWTFSPDQFPKEELKDWESDNGRIEQLYDFDGNYFTSATFPNTLEHYELKRFKELPEEFIGELWENDKYVDKIFCVSENIYLVVGSHADWDDQGYMTRTEYPAVDLLEKMRAGYSIGNLFYYDGLWYIFYHRKK